jgi:hypothetical protein
MFRRRPKPVATPDPEHDGVDAIDVEGEAATGAEPATGSVPTGPAGKPARANGPWDVDELDGSHPSHARARIDLGGLRIRPVSGMRIQMQVDSATGRATSVLMVSEQAAVQLMVIAAAKSALLWPRTITAVAADARRRGGTATQAEGPWGPVLQMSVPVTTADGSSGVQPSLVIGIDGPRWMVRATLIGQAATDQKVHDQMMLVVQDTVVVRGEVPMAPGELIELRPPPRPEPQDADEPSPRDDPAPES